MLLIILILAGKGMATCVHPSFGGNVSDPMNMVNLLKRAYRNAKPDLSGENVARISRVMPKDSFQYLFPRANQNAGPGNGPYSYENFLLASSMWPHFCNEAFIVSADLDYMCKLELASMFAMFAQETGANDASSSYPTWRQALYYFNELNCADNGPGCEYTGPTCDPTSWQGKAWPCAPGKKYYGRGAHQLTYNYNYGQFSNAVFGNVSVLLDDPSLVVEGWLSLASAMWFYMTPQSPKPSMHDVVTGFWQPNANDEVENRVPGFGVLIMIINGGIECGKVTAQAQNRISFYKSFCEYFGVDAGSLQSQGCEHMTAFGTSSSASVPAYWEQDWSTSCACKLVQYQTPFSLYDGDSANSDIDIPYTNCVFWHFKSTTPQCCNNGPVSADLTTPTASQQIGCGSECPVCVAVPGNSQAATDEQCAPCAFNAQHWWPCTVTGLCECSGQQQQQSSSSTNPEL